MQDSTSWMHLISLVAFDAFRAFAFFAWVDCFPLCSVCWKTNISLCVTIAKKYTRSSRFAAMESLLRVQLLSVDCDSRAAAICARSHQNPDCHLASSSACDCCISQAILLCLLQTNLLWLGLLPLRRLVSTLGGFLRFYRLDLSDACGRSWLACFADTSAVAYERNPFPERRHSVPAVG